MCVLSREVQPEDAKGSAASSGSWVVCDTAGAIRGRKGTRSKPCWPACQHRGCLAKLPILRQNQPAGTTPSALTILASAAAARAATAAVRVSSSWVTPSSVVSCATDASAACACVCVLTREVQPGGANGVWCVVVVVGSMKGEGGG
jgi:hypothetical protein